MARIFNSHSLTFSSGNSSDYVDDQGFLVKGAPDTTIIVRGSLQSLSPHNRLKKLPEGVSLDDMRVFYTKTKLTPYNQYTKSQADYTTIDGIEYEIYDVINNTGYLADKAGHYGYILVNKALVTR